MGNKPSKREIAEAASQDFGKSIFEAFNKIYREKNEREVIRSSVDAIEHTKRAKERAKARRRGSITPGYLIHQ